MDDITNQGGHENASPRFSGGVNICCSVITKGIYLSGSHNIQESGQQQCFKKVDSNKKVWVYQQKEGKGMHRFTVHGNATWL